MKIIINSAAALLLLSSCADDPENPLESAAAVEAAASYSEVVDTSYALSTAQVATMQTAIDAFIADPSEANLTSARNAWLAARPSYLETEVFRFYDGPIDGQDGDPEGLINAWPMDEFTVDYVDGMPEAGRINDASFEITEANITAANGEGGEADVATGWHAIEFLLWGQDLTTPEMNMPGQRPADDYDGAANAERRAQYLQITTAQLKSNMDGLVAEWNAGGDYRTAFDAETAGERLRRALTGMIILSGFETGGERLQAALDAGDQEEEHSCFSDNTHIDMIHDLIGVQNVWLGRVGSYSGTGIDAVVRLFDATLADEVTARIQTSIDLARALVPPFDLEIQPGNAEGNARVQALIDSCATQEDLLSQVFVGLGFTVPSAE